MGFNFEDLDVYGKAIDLVDSVYSLTKIFPKDEMFGLTSQLRRAAVSISLNISEGSARSKKDFSRFIDMARGSVFECVTLLQISLKQGYIYQEKFIDLKNELTDISKMLSGLKRSINCPTMNDEQRTMNYKLRTNKAFTLIELVVAVAILAVVIASAGMIFRLSIEAHRTSIANAEIMQKLRAITDQLNSDFKGIRTDAPLLVWFEQESNPADPNRCDQILFFADGDFQSTQLYSGGFPSVTGNPVVGNVARIYYGQAYSFDPADDKMQDPRDIDFPDRLLARRQHILTADSTLYEWPNSSFADFDKNELYEHDSLSLAQWKTVDVSTWQNSIVDVCFDSGNQPYNRPLIDMDDPNTFHKLMCEGVGSFAIQWAYWDDVDKVFYWFPSDDPDGDKDDSDSHFDLMGTDRFGVFFNIPNGSQFDDWYPVEDAESKSGESFSPLKAFKFTFTLYDSKGVIKEGKTFTHIVYLAD